MCKSSWSLLLIGCLGTFVFGRTDLRAQPPADVERVRDLLLEEDDSWKDERRQLIQLGEKVFPAFEAILSDPKAKPHQVARIFGVLYAVKADRRRFLEHAVRGLANADSKTRWAAVELLGQIGTPAEASPVVALLSDGNRVADQVIVYSAAKTLAAIGGPREVIAMDVWLLGASHRNDPQLRRHVAQCRDKLKERLDKMPKDPTKEKR